MNILSAMRLVKDHDTQEHEALEAWSYLIQTGLVWSLGEHEQSVATDLIDRGVVDRNGIVLCACS